MLCGVSRLSVRSIVATATFFSTAVATVLLFHRAPTPPLSSATPTFNLPLLLLFQIPLVLYRYIIPYVVSSKWYNFVSSFFIAGHFAFGLSLAGMLQPSKIQNFLVLPFSSTFDPSLAFVAVGGVLPNIIAWLTQIRYATKPIWTDFFKLPSKKDVNWILILGSVVFGFGWGWLGVCPGPGVVMQGAFMDQGQSVGLWVLGMTVGCAVAIEGSDILNRL
jgi:uncharacterized membrane protein YedE/YeeE